MTKYIIAVSLILLTAILLLVNLDPAPLAGQVVERLAENGAVLYVVADEPESERQLADFGAFVEQLTVVNCTEQPEFCLGADITDVPAVHLESLNFELVGYRPLPDWRKLLVQLQIW